ncbi:MAG TPA: hypothetical protein VF865_02715 [Acidobacteriaceae bacterium]
MKTGLTTLAKFFATGSLLIGTFSALAQPTVISPTVASAPNGIAPNGIGATTSELLFSEPFCGVTGIAQPRGVYSVTNFIGADPSLTATVTETAFHITYYADFLPPPQCDGGLGAENYFIISPGSGGFPAGWVYATNPIDAGHDQVLVSNGGPAATFVASIVDTAPGHAGITFDTVGTFGFALIVTTPSAVYGFNSGGGLAFTYPVTASGVLLESATVAPLSNTACPGCLYVTSVNGSNTGSIYTIAPGTPSGTALGAPIASVPGAEPEGILFVPAQSCTLTGTNLSYFVSGYAIDGQIDVSPSTHGALLGFTQAQLAPYVGDALIPIETGGGTGGGGTIQVFNPVTKAFSLFSSTAYQLEGASLVACPPATGCPATQGFWKHHLIPVPSLTIGGITYTRAQLVAILNTPAGGNATLILMHQLIAALANEAAGAQHVGVVEDGVSVDTAIAQAQTLLASVNNGFVDPSSTLGGEMTALATVLDDYNSAVGLNCSEASGLTLGVN